MPCPPPPPWDAIFTQWTPDKHHWHIVKNATHLDPMLVPSAKGFMGTLIKTWCQLGTKSWTWHQVLWLRRGVEGTVGLANKDMMDAIFNPMEPGVAHTYEFHLAFLSRSSPHIAHLPIGEGQVIFWRGPYHLEVCKTGPTNADAIVRFALGGVIPPTCPCLEAPEASKIGAVVITCRYAFALHISLRMHIAYHFSVNFARISHNSNLESNVLYHEFHTNFTPIPHGYCTTRTGEVHLLEPSPQLLPR